MITGSIRVQCSLHPPAQPAQQPFRALPLPNAPLRDPEPEKKSKSASQPPPIPDVRVPIHQEDVERQQPELRG